jgi:O-antigen/teichoic acid export membrane protein
MNINFTQLLRSKLLKDSASYTVINVLDKSIPFLLISVIARYISKEEMGYYTLYQVLFNLLIPVLTLSMDNAVLINYYKLKKNEFGQYLSLGIILTVIFYIFFCSISFFFSAQVYKISGLPLAWFQITMLIVLFQFLNQLRKNLWRFKNLPIKYGQFSIPLTLLKNFLGLVFVIFLNYSWKAMILGHLIGESIFSIISITSFYKENLLKLRFAKSFIIDLIKVGVPISVHRISAWLSFTINRLIINSLLGAAATGSYGVGATFSVILTVLEDAINKAYAPYLYEKLSKFNFNNARKIVKIIFAYYSFFSLLSLLICVVGYFGVGIIFGDVYLDTRVFIIPIVLSSMFNGYYKLHVNIILFTKKTYIISRITMICAIINIGIAYVMIDIFGLLGAAFSQLIVQILMYSLTLYYSNKQYKLPWLYFTSL